MNRDVKNEFVEMHTDEMALHCQAEKNYGGIFRLGHRAASAMHRLAAELYRRDLLEEADEVGDMALTISRRIEDWKVRHVWM